MKKLAIALVICLCAGCGGGGTTVVTPPVVTPPPPVVVTPLAVSKLSYVNKNDIPFDNTTIPTSELLGLQRSPEESIVNDRSVAFADFFQEGKYSAFFVTWRFTNRFPECLPGVCTPNPIVDSQNKAYFAREVNGKWVDETAKLIPDPADRLTCVSHSYTLISDFNNDGKPDLFVSCSGIDFTIPNIQTRYPTTWRTIMFEEQVVLLSQPNGTYKKKIIPGNIYGHHATTADINNDGNVDIVTTNASWGNTNPYEDLRPYFLMGNGDGTFTKDYNRIPQNFRDNTNPYAMATSINVYWTYLMPIEGRVDLIMVGDKIAWYKNPGNGNFSNVVPTFLPLAGGGPDATPLDMQYRDGYFYVNHSGGNWPGTMRIYKIRASDMAVTLMYSRSTATAYSEGAIVPTLKFSADGKYLIPYAGDCGKERSDPNFSLSKCGLKIPLN